ncbi:MAG: SAM hydrolase/SAM-dependent halogenase family protein [Deltaproteobacteria bacterium]
MSRIITLTTDFGIKDHYAGSMKGAALSVNPGATIVDITHEIPKFDILCGAFSLGECCRHFPKGTIHIAVVDPGVGSARKPIAVDADGDIFIGPDNGIFTFILREAKRRRAFEISNPKFMSSSVSQTFHGRDIFAPAAAHISLGAGIEDLGGIVEKTAEISIPKPRIRGGEILGEVIYTDSFGNLVTNIPSIAIPRGARIYAGDSPALIEGVSKSYAEVGRGELLAIIGSGGFLEISVNQGRASDVIGGKSIRVLI